MTNLLGLDVGDKRVGVAIVADGVAVPRSLPTLNNDDFLFDKLQSIILSKNIEQIVVGLPRNLDGDDTAQTKTVHLFAAKIAKIFKISVSLQDEALTSVLAEQSLKASNRSYNKSDVDSLAARQILLDFIL